MRGWAGSGRLRSIWRRCEEPCVADALGRGVGGQELEAGSREPGAGSKVKTGVRARFEASANFEARTQLQSQNATQRSHRLRLRLQLLPPAPGPLQHHHATTPIPPLSKIIQTCRTVVSCRKRPHCAPPGAFRPFPDFKRGKKRVTFSEFCLFFRIDGCSSQTIQLIAQARQYRDDLPLLLLRAGVLARKGGR